MIRYGPAGWDYKDWAGIVYPAPRPRGFDPLVHLARYFDTVEINSTFYGPPKPKTVRTWMRRVREFPDFRFTAKLYKRFTHERKTAWSAAEVKEARAGLDVLHGAGKLGALLLQFPWSFRRDDAGREWLDDLTRTFEDFPLVVEVRHESWNDPEFFRALIDRGVGFVNIDQPQYSDSIGPSARTTSCVGYVRVHGRNYQDWWRHSAPHERYDYLYSAAQLKPWAERTKEIAAATDDAFVITNNHYRGQAPANALMLQSMVEDRKVPAPATLVEEYAEVLAPFVAPADPPDPEGGA